MAQFVIMKPGIDNVATALSDLPAGATLAVGPGSLAGDQTVTLLQPIKFGHKFALRAINRGESVIKYGQVIGTATRAIAAGEHAHVQNIESNRGRGDRLHANG